MPQIWWQAIHELTDAMLRLDRAVWRTDVDPDAEISVELPALAQPDLAQLSEIVHKLRSAGALSSEAAVDILHPDWSEDEKAAETQRLNRKDEPK